MRALRSWECDRWILQHPRALDHQPLNPAWAHFGGGAPFFGRGHGNLFGPRSLCGSARVDSIWRVLRLMDKTLHDPTEVLGIMVVWHTSDHAGNCLSSYGDFASRLSIRITWVTKWVIWVLDILTEFP